MAKCSSCCGGTTLVFSCSGAADVGAVADRAARLLTQEGKGQMFCLAGVGGRVSGIMKTTEAADNVVAIDGCPLNCAARCLEEAGFDGFGRLQLADLGMVKGSTSVDDGTVTAAARAAEQLLNDGNGG